MNWINLFKVASCINSIKFVINLYFLSNLANMEMSNDLKLQNLKRKVHLQKKKKIIESSSSSNSSLGAADNIINVSGPLQGHANRIKDVLFTMGHAMENAVLGDPTRDAKKNHHRKDKIKHRAKSLVETQILPLLQQPVHQLDFLQRRKFAAAQMRLQRESEMEQEQHKHHLLNMHYLPPVLQDAATLNRRRFQSIQAWSKAQERIGELKLNKFRHKKKGSFINNGQRLIKKTWKYLDKSTEHFMRFKLWARDLKWMECSFGSSMMITFAFLRWVFLLNFFLSIIWCCAICLPFILHPPKLFDWNTFKAAIEGIGIEKSWLYYGGYLYAIGEQTGWYHTDYMYPLTIVATILISLFAVLARITVRILETGSKTLGASGNLLYPFSTLTFATWDSHLTSFEGATIMRRSIRMQLRERLADDKNQKEEAQNKPHTLLKRYLALLILWPMLLAASAGCEYYLVTFGDDINDRVGVYADSVLISLVNSISPRMVKTLVNMEDWKPATHERVTIIKLYFLRILNLSTILYRSYIALWISWQSLEGKEPMIKCKQSTDCNDGFICCMSTNIGEWHLCTNKQAGFCVAGCTENWVANELMGMIVITTIMNVGVAIFQALFTIMWYKTKGSLDITDFIVDIVYMQALVWITSIYSPLASMAGCFSNLVTFICFKNVLFYTCKPIQKPYSASRTSNLTYGMLLGTLLFSIIPIAVEFTTASAAFCGPIRKQISMYAVLNNYIKEAPKEFATTINILSNTWLQWAAILGLMLGLIVMRAKLKQSFIFASLTRRELEMSRRFVRHGSNNYKRLSIEG